MRWVRGDQCGGGRAKRCVPNVRPSASWSPSKGQTTVWKQVTREKIFQTYIFSCRVKNACRQYQHYFCVSGQFSVTVTTSSVLCSLFLTNLKGKKIYDYYFFKILPFFPSQIFPDPGHFLSPEETYISVAEVEYGIQIHKPENDHHKKKEKGNGVHKVWLIVAS